MALSRDRTLADGGLTRSKNDIEKVMRLVFELFSSFEEQGDPAGAER